MIFHKFSLSVLCFQILAGKPLGKDCNADTVLKMYRDQQDPLIQHLLGDIFSGTSRPSKRPKAIDIAQRFLDQYNDSCLTAEDTDFGALLRNSKALIDQQRLKHAEDNLKKQMVKDDSKGRKSETSDPAEAQQEKTCLTEEETKRILRTISSWDTPGSNLRLAPECMFILGGGLVWGVVDINHIPIEASRVSRATVVSQDGTINSFDC